MKRDKINNSASINTSADKQIINIEQIRNLNNINPVIKFCAFIADRINYKNIVIITSNYEKTILEEDFTNIFPLIIIHSENYFDLENSLWSNINEFIEKFPLAILFIHIPNLINLNTTNKNNVINKVTKILTNHGVTIDHIGWSYQTYGYSGLLISLTAYSEMPLAPPKDFNITALLAVRNEEDIIKQTVDYLSSQGIEVYIIDNWSTDNTIKNIEQMMGNKIIGFEKWPKDKPPDYYSLEGILKRKEELAQELNADWLLNYDADEIRESPWRNTTLREAFWRVDQQGFNAVDFTLLNFRPIDNSFTYGDSLIEHFKYCEFGDRPGHFNQLKAWKKQCIKVDLLSAAGHRVNFPNQKIFPYKFLTRHYPLRNQAQAEKKIILDRINRLDPEAIKRGWHSHYQNYDLDRDIIKRKENLISFDNNFYFDYLIERLTGVGIRHDSIMNLETELNHIPFIADELERKVKCLENEILFYAQSNSWKITRPLRKLIRFFRLKGK